MVDYAWLIPIFPLLAFLFHVAVGKRLGERAAWVGVAGMGLSFILSTLVLLEAINGSTAKYAFPWLIIGDTTITMGYRVGPLESVMLFMVSLIGWMVVLYSTGYMHGDRRFNRFFSIVNLFLFGMLTLVLSDNFLLFLFAWEIMGLSSYLLIGHWFEDLNNARAAMKAFLTTRLGDAGLIVGIALLFAFTGSFVFDDVESVVSAGTISVPILTLIALLIFAGAAGKSAQVPLHVWLPDAMAGPTPVSAMIHAATMVAAGVFLVARSFPIFSHAPTALVTVAFIGGITALLAATIATVQTDIKKVLAYSTISQLGYMMLSLGVGGYAAALFHLITHAFFKALLFLGSGSVIHASGTQEMHQMGGLFSKMKITASTFILGTLALAGVPFFAGYFSKDEIILHVWHSPYKILFWMAVLTAFLTAYYMTRAVVLTFFGRPRDREVFERTHESPLNMTLPLLILAVPAAISGFFGAPMFDLPIQRFMTSGQLEEVTHSGFVQMVVLGFALAGILIGFWVYAMSSWRLRQSLLRGFTPIYVLLKQKWFFDHVAMGITYGTTMIATVVAYFDRWVVDGIVNGLGSAVLLLGSGARRLTVGNAHAYILTMFAAIIVGIMIFQAIGG